MCRLTRLSLRVSFSSLIIGGVLALWTAGMSAEVFAQEIKGAPWKGQPGVTESVAAIMAREQNAAPGSANWGQSKTRRHAPEAQVDNPDAPAVSQWPPSASTDGNGKARQWHYHNVLGATASDQPFTSALSQTVSTSFLAATVADSGFIPPDSMGAVGPSQILVVINGRVRTFTKAGVQDGAIDVSTNSFFGSVTGGATTTDPRVIYDTLTQRWFVTMITDGASPNRVMIAVSSGSTITSSSSFTFFYFVQDSPGGSPNLDTGNFADFPSLGLDKFALYIGVNIYDPAGTTYLDSTVFVVNKASLLTGTPPTPTVTAFRGIASGSVDGPFSPQGVSNMDPNATEGYFAGPDTITFSNLRFLRVTNPGGTPTITTLSLNVPANRTPLTVPANGSTHNLDGIDSRLAIAQMVVKPDGTKTLWTAQTTRLNASGLGCALPNCDRDGVRFYEIGNMTTTPTLVQSSTLFDAAASNPTFLWVPSVAVSGQGHMIMASSYAGALNFAGIAVTGRLYSDPLGTLNSTPALIAGNAAYNIQNVTPQRWGDYTNTVVDPADNMTMWTFQELTNAANSWGLQVVKLLAPPPATPSSVAPSTVAAGTTVNITLTGTSSGGSGFYDPGAGFPNRLSATVSGTGVTVNSVTYTDSTHITLNVTIASNAAQSGRTITVTNPDGQPVTSAANFLTVGPPVQITLTPATLPAATVGVVYGQTITASGGTGPYTFSITSGGLPAGVILISSATTGTITGTPTTSGTASFTVQAQDSLGSVGSLSYNLSVQTLLTSTTSLPLVSTSYDATPLPNYNAGKFTLNTNLTNNGATIKSTSRLYFKISSLMKFFGDPLKPDALLTADNGNGGVGDIQTVNLGGVDFGAGQSKPVAFTVGIGTANTFNIGLDLYMVAAGSAMTALEGTAITSSATTSPADTLLGHFEFTGAETLNPTGSSTSSFTVTGSFSNVGVITGPGAQSRPAVAVDPILQNRIAIASNDYLARRVRISTSQDGGVTWNSTTLTATAGGETFFVAQNPSLAFDSLGRLSVVYTLANLEDAANAIVISESSDLVHFNLPTAITFHPPSEQIIDSRPVIAINSNVGRIVAWDRLSENTSRYSIMATRSAEGGPFDQQPVTVVGNMLGSSPALALSGHTVYLGWDEWGFNSTKPYTTGGRLMIAVSSSDTNDGNSNNDENQDPNNSQADLASSNPRPLRFDAPREIAKTAIGFGQRIPAMPDAGVGPDLALAADPRNEANVYAVFADRGTGIDIRCGHSTNRGQTWEFAKVNNDTGTADHFNPSITVDAAGNLKIGFYDTRFSSTSETAHVFLARRSATGSSFDNQRVTTALINDSKTNPWRDTTANLGDRTAITMMNGDVLMAWTDTRNGSEDIFASSVFDPVGHSISGTGMIKFAAGSYVPNTATTGTAEFGFEAGYRKSSSVPDGSMQFRFQTGKAKLTFSSTSYESLAVSGATAELRGSGKVNGAEGYRFILTVSDGEISGTGTDKLRIKIVNKVTGDVIFDNVPGAPDAMNDTVLQPITGGRIEIHN